VTRWSLEALGGTADMVARNNEGSIIAETPLMNPKTNKPIQGMFSKRILPSPSALSVTYPMTAGDLLVRWGVLAAFSVFLLAAASIALNRSESF
jgi:hypothetical protein